MARAAPSMCSSSICSSTRSIIWTICLPMCYHCHIGALLSGFQRNVPRGWPRRLAATSTQLIRILIIVMWFSMMLASHHRRRGRRYAAARCRATGDIAPGFLGER
jgi:hypothetical protein